MGRRTLALASLLTLFGVAPTAHAQGFEYAASGTRALGRGGAFAARADDPMALAYNPAALAFLPNYQLMLGSNLAFYDACVQRSGGYGDSGDPTTDGWLDSRYGTFDDFADPENFSNQSFPRVCRDGFPGPSPQLVFTGHPIPELGFAIGLLAPSAVGNGAWGDGDGSIDVDGTLLPSPVRYALVDQNLLLFHPSIGVGWSPIKEIAFGLTLQWGIAVVDFVNHTSSGSGAEDPGADVRTELSVSDLFVPAMIASVHVVPIDQLDIVASARFSDSIDADGDLRLTTGVNGIGGDFGYDRLPDPTVIRDTHLHAGQPWQFGLSIRYADRTHERYRDPEQAGRVTGRVEDRMQNEVWDLELDLVYTLNSQVTDFVVTPPAGAAARVCEGNATPEACDGTSFDAVLPGRLALPHGWQDQLSIRVGSDWNVVPGVVAVRAGAHFQTSGLSGTYQIQDVLPGMRLGLHIGATFRIERFDISIAYAHIFQFDETVTDGNYRLVAATGAGGQCPGTTEYDPDQPVTSRGCYPQGAGAIVNNGTYSAEYNVVSLQASYHFE